MRVCHSQDCFFPPFSSLGTFSAKIAWLHHMREYSEILKAELPDLSKLDSMNFKKTVQVWGQHHYVSQEQALSHTQRQMIHLLGQQSSTWASTQSWCDIVLGACLDLPPSWGCHAGFNWSLPFARRLGVVLCKLSKQRPLGREELSKGYLRIVMIGPICR